MTAKATPPRPRDPPEGAPDVEAVETAVRVLGGKWKIMILVHLYEGPRRFSELRRRVPPISQQSLTMQLRELERDGVIDRRIFAEIPPRVEYSLTEIGLKISSLISPLMEWGYTILRFQRERGESADSKIKPNA